MIHHIAIATNNLQIMAAFYKSLPGLSWKENQFRKDGSIRSVWFETKNKCLLMLEEFPYSKAPEAIVFQLNTDYNFKTFKIPLTKKTDYTFYFLDPDDNQLGYSSYPTKFNANNFPNLKNVL